MPWNQFPGNRPNNPQSPNDVASRPLPKSPVSSSLDNVVPHLIIRSPRVRPGKFVFSDAKRLLQQYLPTTEVARLVDQLVGLAVSNARIALPNFYNIAIRIANVAARLAVLGLRLRDELGSSTSPKLITRLNICNADIHKAAD